MRSCIRWHKLNATGLGDVRAHDCSFQKGVQYCGKYYWGEAAATTQASAPATAASGAVGSGAASSGPAMTPTATSESGLSIAASSKATSAMAALSNASPSGDAASSNVASSANGKSSLPIRVSLPAHEHTAPLLPRNNLPLLLSWTFISTHGQSKLTIPQKGASITCTRYIDVARGEKCGDVLKKASLDIKQFYALNAGVKGGCSNLWPSEC